MEGSKGSQLLHWTLEVAADWFLMIQCRPRIQLVTEFTHQQWLSLVAISMPGSLLSPDTQVFVIVVSFALHSNQTKSLSLFNEITCLLGLGGMSPIGVTTTSNGGFGRKLLQDNSYFRIFRTGIYIIDWWRLILICQLISSCCPYTRLFQRAQGHSFTIWQDHGYNGDDGM